MVSYASVVCWLVLLPFTFLLLLLALVSVTFYYRHKHSLDLMLISYLLVLILRVCTLIPVQASQTIGNLRWSRDGCRAYFWWSISLQMVEILHLVTLAIDRLLIVRMPLRYHHYASFTTINTTLAALWMIGCLGSLPLTFWVTKDYSKTRCRFVSSELDKGFAIFGFVLEVSACILLGILFVDCFVFLKHNRVSRTIYVPKNLSTAGYQQELKNQDSNSPIRNGASPFQRGGVLRKTFINNNPKRFKLAYDTCKIGIALAFTCIATNHLPYSLIKVYELVFNRIDMYLHPVGWMSKFSSIMALIGLASSVVDVGDLRSALLWFVLIEALAVPPSLWLVGDRYHTSLRYIVKYLTCGKFGHGALLSANRTTPTQDDRGKISIAVVPVKSQTVTNVINRYKISQETSNMQEKTRVDTMELGFTAAFDIESITTVKTETTVDDNDFNTNNNPNEPEEEPVAINDVVMAQEFPRIEEEVLEDLEEKASEEIDVTKLDTRSIKSELSGVDELERGVSTRGSFLGSGFHTIMMARRKHVDRYDAVSISSLASKTETRESSTPTPSLAKDEVPGTTAQQTSSTDDGSIRARDGMAVKTDEQTSSTDVGRIVAKDEMPVTTAEQTSSTDDGSIVAKAKAMLSSISAKFRDDIAGRWHERQLKEEISTPEEITDPIELNDDRGDHVKEKELEATMTLDPATVNASTTSSAQDNTTRNTDESITRIGSVVEASDMFQSFWMENNPLDETVNTNIPVNTKIPEVRVQMYENSATDITEEPLYSSKVDENQPPISADYIRETEYSDGNKIEKELSNNPLSRAAISEDRVKMDYEFTDVSDVDERSDGSLTAILSEGESVATDHEENEGFETEEGAPSVAQVIRRLEKRESTTFEDIDLNSDAHWDADTHDATKNENLMTKEEVATKEQTASATGGHDSFVDGEITENENKSDEEAPPKYDVKAVASQVVSEVFAGLFSAFKIKND